MIVFNKVSKIYNHNSIALDCATFKIQPKEFIILIGKSGAGKSTILKLLIGEEKPTKGRILFDDYEVNKLKSSDMPNLRRQIGVIFQDFRLLDKKTSFENVAFALEVEGRSQREINKLVPLALDMVGIGDKADHFPTQLSGGEKQRVAIARAMINRPKVLIADEPTGNLDLWNSKEVIKLLIKINEMEHGSTVILATHDTNVIKSLMYRTITLDKGAIIKDDPGR